MEIAVRKYGSYGITVIGAVAGTLLVYALSAYIKDNTYYAKNVFNKLGQSSIIVLIIHTVFAPIIEKGLVKHFDPEYLPFMAFSIIIQLCLAVLINEILSKAKTIRRNQ